MSRFLWRAKPNPVRGRRYMRRLNAQIHNVLNYPPTTVGRKKTSGRLTVKP